jgi:hypothetical protein
VLIGALHTTLENAVVAFRRIDVNFGPGDAIGIFGDIRLHDRDDVLSLRALDMETAQRAAALDKRQDDILVRAAFANLNPLFATDESSVDFDNPVWAAGPALARCSPARPAPHSRHPTLARIEGAQIDRI